MIGISDMPGAPEQAPTGLLVVTWSPEELTLSDQDLHAREPTSPRKGTHPGLIIVWIVLLAIGGGALAYEFLMPSKAEINEKRWREVEQARQYRRQLLAREKAEREKYERTVLALNPDAGAARRSNRESKKKGRKGHKSNRRVTTRKGKPVVVRWKVEQGKPSPSPAMGGIPATRTPPPANRAGSKEVIMYMTPT